jgi:hypothetical protein
MIRQAPPDRDHLAVRGRIPGGASEVAPARNDRAIPHDHPTEREVALTRLLDRHVHETDIRVRTRPRQLRKGCARHDGGAGDPSDEGTPAGNDVR